MEQSVVRLRGKFESYALLNRNPMEIFITSVTCTAGRVVACLSVFSCMHWRVKVGINISISARFRSTGAHCQCPRVQ